MKRRVRLDYETASEIDLKDLGLDVYSAHKSTRVLMVAFSIDGQPIRLVEKGGEPLTVDDLPLELVEALLDPHTLKIGFNASFERIITTRVLGIRTPYSGWRCTMVRGFGAAFTGDLGMMGAAMGLPGDKLKDKRGKELIRLFSMPQRITKKNPHRWLNKETNPVEWQEFCDYCEQDVVAEGAMWDWLAPLPFPEIEWVYYEIDQRINDRGLPVDLKFCEAALAMYERFLKKLHERMIRLTGVDNPNSPAQLTVWLKTEGYWFSDLRGETVEKVIRESTIEIDGRRVLRNDALITADALEVLQLREQSSYTSVKKYQAILDSAGRGNNVRNTYQFGGAARTLRDAGRGVQTQNLMRPPKYFEDAESRDENGDVIAEVDGYTKVMACVQAVLDGDDDLFALLVPFPTEALAGMVRSAFAAPEGKEFRVCDLSSIESCGLGWISDCKRLQKVFADKRDPYKDFGTVFYAKPYEKITKAERNICKPPTLGCGYRLGGGKLFEGKKTGLWGYAENMGVFISQEDSAKAVALWRQTYPEVPQLWKKYEEAVKQTMDTERPVKVGPVSFQKMAHRGSYFLKVTLPSGRSLWYHKPRMEARKVKTGRFKRVWQEGIQGQEDGYVEVEETFDSIAFTYMGQEQKTRQWMRLENHGGRFVEQIDQALSRDVLWVGIHRCHEEGFRVVGRVHDEIVAIEDINDQTHTVARMRELMIAPKDWWQGLHLNAAGWSGPRYKKD